MISTIASGSVYAALNHWMSLSGPVRDVWMTGAATCTMVASSRFIASASNRPASATHRCLCDTESVLQSKC